MGSDNKHRKQVLAALLIIGAIAAIYFFGAKQTVIESRRCTLSWDIGSYDVATGKLLINYEVSGGFNLPNCIGTYQVDNNGFSVFNGKRDDCKLFGFDYLWTGEGTFQGSRCRINDNWFEGKTATSAVTCSHTRGLTAAPGGGVMAVAGTREAFNPGFNGFEMGIPSRYTGDDYVTCSGNIVVQASPPAGTQAAATDATQKVSAFPNVDQTQSPSSSSQTQAPTQQVYQSPAASPQPQVNTVTAPAVIATAPAQTQQGTSQTIATPDTQKKTIVFVLVGVVVLLIIVNGFLFFKRRK